MTGPAREAWLLHLDSCRDCNYDREFCGACEIGEDQISEHGCNCPRGGNGYAMRKAAKTETAGVRTVEGKMATVDKTPSNLDAVAMAALTDEQRAFVAQGFPLPAAAKAALYLAALEALLADLPDRCGKCGLPAEWTDYEGESWCGPCRGPYASSVDYQPIVPSLSLAQARAAIGWEAK